MLIHSKQLSKTKIIKKDECWINTIYDFYKNTLLSDKRRKHITRETILNDSGMTEDTLKKGISLNKIVVLFFEKKKI